MGKSTDLGKGCLLGLGRAPLLKVGYGWVGHRWNKSAQRPQDTRTRGDGRRRRGAAHWCGSRGTAGRESSKKQWGEKIKRRVVFAVRLLPQRVQGKFRIRNILEILFRNAMIKNQKAITNLIWPSLHLFPNP